MSTSLALLYCYRSYSCTIVDEFYQELKKRVPFYRNKKHWAYKNYNYGNNKNGFQYNYPTRSLSYHCNIPVFFCVCLFWSVCLFVCLFACVFVCFSFWLSCYFIVFGRVLLQCSTDLTIMNQCIYDKNKQKALPIEVNASCTSFLKKNKETESFYGVLFYCQKKQYSYSHILEIYV